MPVTLLEDDVAEKLAEKAAFVKKVVVGQEPSVARVAGSKEGLLVSLDHWGRLIGSLPRSSSTGRLMRSSPSRRHDRPRFGDEGMADCGRSLSGGTSS
jgi:hypothetical protein